MGVDAKTFYAASLGDIFIFATLIFFAFRERFNPAAHKRLILIGTITLLGAAINRWPFEIILRQPILINVIDDAFLLPLIAYDLYSMRKVHSATIWGGVFLIVMQQLELPIGSTAHWQSFATWVLRHGKVLHGAERNEHRCQNGQFVVRMVSLGCSGCTDRVSLRTVHINIGAGGGNRTHGLGIMRPSLYH